MARIDKKQKGLSAWGAMTLIAVMLIGFLSIIAGLNWTYGYLACSGKFKDSNYEYRNKLIGGCQVKTDMGWIPAENMRQL